MRTKRFLIGALLACLTFAAVAQTPATRNEMLARGISSTEYGLNIQRGLIDGISVIHKFGLNSDIDTASGFESLWNGGGLYTGFNATVAETLEVFSDSVNDTAAGTGARTLELRGLTTGFVPLIEIVILDGITTVDTVGVFLRMDRAVILTGGTAGPNDGSITVRQKTTTANVFAIIPPGSGRTLIACYTIPADTTGYVTQGFASLSKKQAATSVIRARFRAVGGVFQTIENFSINSTGNSYVNRFFEIPLGPAEAGTDLCIEADSDSNDVGIAGGFEIILVDTP